MLTRQDTLRGGLGRLRSMIPGMALQEAVEEEGEANDGAADAGDDGAGAEGERVASREEQAEVRARLERVPVAACLYSVAVVGLSE